MSLQGNHWWNDLCMHTTCKLSIMAERWFMKERTKPRFFEAESHSTHWRSQAYGIKYEHLPGHKNRNTRDVVWIDKEENDLPPGSKYDYHRPNKMNYPIPHPNTRSTRLALRSLWSMMTIWLPVLAISWSQNALHLNDILLSCHIHQRKNVRLCRHYKPIHDVHARLKLGKLYMILLLQPTQAWKRNTIPKTTCHVNFGFAPMESIVVWSKKKRILEWPTLPSTWPLKVGTNFPRKEVFTLEDVGF